MIAAITGLAAILNAFLPWLLRRSSGSVSPTVLYLAWQTLRDRSLIDVDQDAARCRSGG